MKLPLISTAMLLAGAMAAPSPAPVEVDVSSLAYYRDADGGITINEANFYNIMAADCSILKCIEVIGAAICIANAIDDDDYAKILKCATKKQICGCAGCIKPLGKFLDKWGIC